MTPDYFHTFSFNGIALSEFGAVIAQKPTHVIAAPDIQLNGIPFSDGDEIEDNGRYSNIEFIIPIRAVPAYCDMDLQTWAYRLKEWLNATKEYKIYRDTYNLGYFRQAVVTEIDEIQAVKKDVYETKITFSFKPFLYRDGGEQALTYTTTENDYIISLENPEMWESNPIIRINGSGTFYLDLNGVEMTLDVDEQITVDKEQENVFDKTGAPCNDRIIGLKIPKLQVGTNIINIYRSGQSSGEYSVDIIPNWRRL